MEKEIDFSSSGTASFNPVVIFGGKVEERNHNDEEDSEYGNQNEKSEGK